MHPTGHGDLTLTLKDDAAQLPPLQWDWDVEHADRRVEARAHAALHGTTQFPVDRTVLKDVVREHIGVEVGRIKFLNAGTFHKAYLVTLANRKELVASVARRFMPRLKTESEVTTMAYLRQYTNVPVPTVYHYDSNPFNRLGGEYILMSKASGIPLSTIFHSLCYSDLVKLLDNVAALFIPLFAHRFSQIGSLYFGPSPYDISHILSSTEPTPKAVQLSYSAYPFSPTLSLSSVVTPKPIDNHLSFVQSGVASDGRSSVGSAKKQFHIGPIVSWPFFGTNRGELAHPTELNRGPWAQTRAYFASCAEREITDVIREGEGRAAPHRLHLDPDEIQSSRHHRVRAVPGDESDESDEWDLEDSEREEWEGPGDAMYRDYRRMQRSTFLVAHVKRREQCVRREMDRWLKLINRLSKLSFADDHGGGGTDDDTGPPDNMDKMEQFGLDCHDLSLDNIFVDEKEPWKVTCIIDWESTTTRPLWQCAHLPAFAQTSPFMGKLFREAVARLGQSAETTSSSSSSPSPAPSLSSTPSSTTSGDAETEPYSDAQELESAKSKLRSGEVEDPPALRPTPPAFALPSESLPLASIASLVPPTSRSPLSYFDAPPAQYDPASLAREWLYYESAGHRLRMAHRFAEWDGWEEGLAESMLGPEEHEEEWFEGLPGYDCDCHGGVHAGDDFVPDSALISPPTADFSSLFVVDGQEHENDQAHVPGDAAHAIVSPVMSPRKQPPSVQKEQQKRATISTQSQKPQRQHQHQPTTQQAQKPQPQSQSQIQPQRQQQQQQQQHRKRPNAAMYRFRALSKVPPLAKEQEKEQMLNTTGDVCGGRGGELGRRLEAWLTVSGVAASRQRKEGEHDADDGQDGRVVDASEDEPGPVQVGAVGAAANLNHIGKAIAAAATTTA